MELYAHPHAPIRRTSTSNITMDLAPHPGNSYRDVQVGGSGSHIFGIVNNSVINNTSEAQACTTGR